MSDECIERTCLFAYANNYLIDTDNAIIVDVEASRAIRQAEVGATRTMIQRTRQKFDLYPEILAADTAYGTAENLNWLLEEEGILPHIPVFDKSRRPDDCFERRDFIYDHQRDKYTCPAGNALRPRQQAYRKQMPSYDANGMMQYRASKLDCDPCPLKEKCCLKAPARKVLRHMFEGARELDGGERRLKCCLPTSSAS